MKLVELRYEATRGKRKKDKNREIAIEGGKEESQKCRTWRKCDKWEYTEIVERHRASKHAAIPYVKYTN